MKDKNISFDCFGSDFILFRDFKSVADSLNEKNISLEYNDSFSGEQEGVKMYSYQSKKDSLVLLNNFYFESGKLKGVSIDITSLEIKNEASFVKNVKERIGDCASIKTDVCIADTSSNNVNPLESASGKIFHLKIYDKKLHEKIPSVF